VLGLFAVWRSIDAMGSMECYYPLFLSLVFYGWLFTLFWNPSLSGTANLHRLILLLLYCLFCRLPRICTGFSIPFLSYGFLCILAIDIGAHSCGGHRWMRNTLQYVNGGKVESVVGSIVGDTNSYSTT
jgi:hypothetical protein